MSSRSNIRPAFMRPAPQRKLPPTATAVLAVTLGIALPSAGRMCPSILLVLLLVLVVVAAEAAPALGLCMGITVLLMAVTFVATAALALLGVLRALRTSQFPDR